MTTLIAFLDALTFAARAHANQRRKGAAQEPYINHLIEVADLAARAQDEIDLDIVKGALLHDVIEDTQHSYDDVSARFGAQVADYVRECSDDMSLPKPERKRRRIADAPHKSPGAKIIKIADVISNLRAMESSPPAGWPLAWRLGYLEGTRELHAGLSGASAWLDDLYVREADRIEEAMLVQGRDMAGADAATTPYTLDTAAGQPVYLVYLANTEATALSDADKDKLASILEDSFPSATILDAEAIFESRRRPIMMVRVRSDTTDAIVALAQRLCVAFAQRFVGVESDGRYFRVYADDTA
ncbi:MAG: HD domain-containing protein [Geminicoccaceae bacterium]